MAIIVAGKLLIKLGAREDFIAQSYDAILLARKNADCLDFAVSPDPIDINRVNVFEKWTSRTALDAFRNAGPENTLFTLVESFDVNEYDIDE